MMIHGHRAGMPETWMYVLVCFALAALVCAAKNYLSVSLQGTPLCGYMCPSVFGERAFALPTSLDWFFALQIGVEEQVQSLFNGLWNDRFLLITGLVSAPVLEECLYRGPLYVFRDRAGSIVWWGAAVLLSVVFALSHSVSGLSLLPLVTLGLASAWLIFRSQKFWPSIALHFLYNFFLLSVTVFQSLYWVD
jgi:membrane protease YdiL (CAAX protease family)